MTTTYVREAVLIEGAAAHVLDRLLARYLPGVIESLPPWLRDEVLSARDGIRRAAVAYEARPVAVDGSAETDDSETSPSWSEQITSGAAATILGVTERRVRQLGAAGLGRKVGRAWVFDRAVVQAERAHRKEAAG
jgi:hypothetical protein